MIETVLKAVIFFILVTSVRFGIPLPQFSYTEQAFVTAYTCEEVPQNPMRCGAFRWENDPNPLNLAIAACPVTWRGRWIYVNGGLRICKDTGRHDFIDGKPHIDILMDTFEEADNFGAPTLPIWYR